MKKRVFFLIVLIIPLLVRAQSRDIEISWDYAVPSTVRVDQTSGLQQSREEATSDILRLELGSLSYSTQWEESNIVDPNSVRVTNVRYGSLTNAELNKSSSAITSAPIIC